MNDRTPSKTFADSAVEFTRADSLVPFPEALSYMQTRVATITADTEREQFWLLEHPALYTAGTSAKAQDLVSPGRFPVFEAGRGGQYTYHGPGQRVGYLMLDLRKRGRDVRGFVHAVEQLVIDTLGDLGVSSERRAGRVGVWVVRDTPEGPREDKIAAIGLRVRKWISFHGLSINLAPDLSHFDGIVPCGIREHGVTSLQDLGIDVSMTELDAALTRQFEHRFAPLLRT